MIPKSALKLCIGSIMILYLISQPAFSLTQRVFERVSARATHGEQVEKEMSAMCGLDEDERLTLDVTGATNSVGYVSCGNAGFECVVNDDGHCEVDPILQTKMGSC